MFITVYSLMFNYDYPCLLVFTYFYTPLPMFSPVYSVYPCLLDFSYVYSCLPMFAPVYLFPLFTRVCLTMFTLVNLCLPLITPVCLPILPMFTRF